MKDSLWSMPRRPTCIKPKFLKIIKRFQGTVEKREPVLPASCVVVFAAIRQLIAAPEPKKKKIGFLVEEKAAGYGRR